MEREKIDIDGCGSLKELAAKVLDGKDIKIDIVLVDNKWLVEEMKHMDKKYHEFAFGNYKEFAKFTESMVIEYPDCDGWLCLDDKELEKHCNEISEGASCRVLQNWMAQIAFWCFFHGDKRLNYIAVDKKQYGE